MIDDPINGGIEENPGAVKREAGNVNSWDAKAGGKRSLDFLSRKASHRSMSNVYNVVDDSAGILLSRYGLGRSQTAFIMNPVFCSRLN